MISWIVASHNRETLQANLAATLDASIGEMILIENAPSIAAAYSDGQDRASFPIRCYVHHDVRILNNAKLVAELVEHVVPTVGMVGMIGAVSRALPWWVGPGCGSIQDRRLGTINRGPGGKCMLLDGVLLATVHHVEWDSLGWHGYDHDACEQMLANGLTNWCLSNGHELIYHDSATSLDPGQVNGFQDSLAWVQAKWGHRW